ncbi:AgrD family cyclic lactone autoinducer peptide [Staphylococcus lutrae]|uniref:Accessory regulator AgrD n=1 Tax=Staphylococcus lutrae TaxID=155085 RepID=A0AAC9RSX8_9STAP|nr:cyclic lactone autoinducer peptide [Staphylococcus lutrae]ARJ50215.1 accessory regulator AgrD [Staphylococcus lutrae]PNZ39329.1 cyclic lactone autoinducer peptide [Staphylococcus lutrae]
MKFFDSILNFIVHFFQSIGNFAKIPFSFGFFDEPEIPEELLEEE